MKIEKNLTWQVFKVWLHCKLEFKIFNIVLGTRGFVFLPP